MTKTLGMAMVVLGMFLAVIGGDSRESAAQAQQATTRGAPGGKDPLQARAAPSAEQKRITFFFRGRGTARNRWCRR